MDMHEVRDWVVVDSNQDPIEVFRGNRFEANAELNRIMRNRRAEGDTKWSYFGVREADDARSSD